MNSRTVLAGTDGFTTRTWGPRRTPATGAMSRMKLKLSFSYNVALVALTVLHRRSVYPSAGARTTASVPRLVAAPVLFSTTNGWPSRSDTHQASDDVGRAARGDWHDQMHRPRRIGLGPREARQGRQGGSASGHEEKS